MMLVSEKMTSPPVLVGPDATLGEIAHVLEKRVVSAVPVASGDRLLGIVSTSDVLRALAAGDDTPHDARSLMTTPVVVARPTETLDEAARRLAAERVHRLVVVEGQRPVGILAPRDILAGLSQRRIVEPIGSFMTTAVQSIEIGDSIATAIRTLAASNVHGLVVVDGQWPIGVFTHQEALAARALPRDLHEQPVEEVMSYETICLDAGNPTFRAVAHALAMDVRRFLVVRERRLVGVVSTLDLVRELARPAEGAEAGRAELAPTTQDARVG